MAEVTCFAFGFLGLADIPTVENEIVAGVFVILFGKV